MLMRIQISRLSTAYAQGTKPLYRPSTFTVVWMHTVITTVVNRSVVYAVWITTLVYAVWITILTGYTVVNNPWHGAPTVVYAVVNRVMLTRSYGHFKGGARHRKTRVKATFRMDFVRITVDLYSIFFGKAEVTRGIVQILSHPLSSQCFTVYTVDSTVYTQLIMEYTLLYAV